MKPKGFIYICATKRFHDMKRDAFQAIADPTRREILNIISLKSLNVNSLNSNFNVSRTAIYKHLKILTECGLVEITKHGREHLCEARLEKLQDVSDWVEQYRKIWTAKLDSLENYLNLIQSKNRVDSKNIKKKKYGKRK